LNICSKIRAANIYNSEGGDVRAREETWAAFFPDDTFENYSPYFDDDEFHISPAALYLGLESTPIEDTVFDQEEEACMGDDGLGPIEE
jgi:hypothetical protein